jgi:hypothetical protein
MVSDRPTPTTAEIAVSACPAAIAHSGIPTAVPTMSKYIADGISALAAFFISSVLALNKIAGSTPRIRMTWVYILHSLSVWSV